MRVERSRLPDMRLALACAALLFAAHARAEETASSARHLLPGTKVIVHRLDGALLSGTTGASSESSLVVHRDGGGFEVLQLSEFRMRASSDGVLHLTEDVISAPEAIDAIGATLVVSTAGLHLDGRSFHEVVVLDPVLAYDGALSGREEMAGTQAHVRTRTHASLAGMGFVVSSSGAPGFATAPVDAGIARLIPAAKMACQETGASAAVLSRIVVRQTFEPDDPESDRKRLSRDRVRWCLNVAHLPLVCGSVVTFPFICVPSELPTYDESVGLRYPKKGETKHHEVIRGVFEVALIDSSGEILWEKRETSRDPWKPDGAPVDALGRYLASPAPPRAEPESAAGDSGPPVARKIGAEPPSAPQSSNASPPSPLRVPPVSLVRATLLAGVGNGFEYEGRQRYRASERMAAIRLQAGAGPGIARGPALTAEASYAEHALGSPRCADDFPCSEPDPGYHRRSPRMGALRAGYHGNHAGLEIGAYGFVVEGDEKWSSGPSVTAWTGAHALHAWLDVNAGEPRDPRPRRGVNEEPYGLGLGHASGRARLRAGLTNSGTMVEAEARVWNAVWIGAQYRGSSDGQSAFAVRVTIPLHFVE